MNESNRNGRTVPAFLSDSHRGLERCPHGTPQVLRGWAPTPGTRKVVSAVAALPKLAAELGLSATDIEILPGSPTTIAFTSNGKLSGMVVLPGDGEDVRRLLGFPEMTTRDPLTDQLWEEQRILDATTPESALDEFPVWS